MKVTDRSLEQWISVLLGIGVAVSGIVVLMGGIYFLHVHGAEPAMYRPFHGAPQPDRSIPRIVSGVASLRPRSIIQFGLLLLIATPVARVLFSLVGFVFERDKKYVLITAIVLAALSYSILEGALQGAMG